MHHLLQGGNTEAINLGTGTGASVLEVIRAVEAVTGISVPREYTNRRVGDPARLAADARKAEKVLGWRPARSDLHQVVRDAWRWHRGLNS